MNYFIITGTSRGIGEAIAKNLLKKGNEIFCISRNRNPSLDEIASNRKVEFLQFEFDLAELNHITDLMNKIFQKIDLNKARKICLINNAGTLDPMKPVEKCTSGEIEINIAVNLTSVIILCSEFIKRAVSENNLIDRRIINISSGAGKRPVKSWSCYCASKAGVDLFTRTIALEQEDSENPVKIISFAPGVVDTPMQEKIRSTSEEDFPDVERFITLKNENSLLDADYVAKEIIKLTETNNFKHGGVVRINEPEN
jgi:benzil reductase ((S)-benzoin forming)